MYRISSVLFVVTLGTFVCVCVPGAGPCDPTAAGKVDAAAIWPHHRAEYPKPPKG